MTIQYPGRRVLVPTPNVDGVRIFQSVVSGISYLLRDEFITDLPAGSVNGTAAEPGPGTRTVVDTDGDALSISGGVLTFANPNASWGDPGIWYDALTRTAGRVLILQLILPDNTSRRYVGFDINQSSVANENVFAFQSTGVVCPYEGGFLKGIVASYVANTYNIALALKAVGAYMFIKGGTFTNWTLLWMMPDESTATLYPAITPYNSAFTADSIRIPDLLWLPPPVAYDSFTRGDGPLGTSETGGPDGQAVTGRTWNFDAGVWTVDTNKAKGSPVAGGELVVNGDFSAWTGDNPDNWTVVEDGINTEVSEVGPGEGHGGTGTGLCNFWRDGAGGYDDPGARQDNVLTPGSWYLVSIDVDTITAGAMIIKDRSAGGNLQMKLDTGSTTEVGTGQAIDNQVWLRNLTDPGDVTVDNVSAKALTLSELFATVDDGSTSDVVISADLTIADNCQAGVVLNLDDESNPANFVIALYNRMDYIDSARLVKCVAGVYTSVISAAATYAAGATLVVVKDGTDYSLYYNNAKIGSTSTISDAGIVSNTKHGLFSTYSGNTLDNFTLFPRGTGGEYSDLDDY